MHEVVSIIYEEGRKIIFATFPHRHASPVIHKALLELVKETRNLKEFL